MLSKTFISNSNLPSFSIYPPQHSHLCYIHFVNMLLLDWPTFCSIGPSWSNHCPIKFFLQSCWHSPVTKHSRSKSPLQPSCFNPIFDIFINLLILTNYRAKVAERITWWHLMVFNSHSNFSFFYIPIEVTNHLFGLCTAYFKPLDSNVSRHLSSFVFTPSLDSSTNTISSANNMYQGTSFWIWAQCKEIRAWGWPLMQTYGHRELPSLHKQFSHSLVFLRICLY